MTGRHFPLNIGLNLAAGVTAGGQTLPQALGMTAEQDDAVNLQKMGEMAVHQPPTVVGRLPGLRQTVNIDGRCAVVFVHWTEATVRLGKVGQRQHLPARLSQGRAQRSFPRPRRS